jgi:hypothetical protein
MSSLWALPSGISVVSMPREGNTTAVLIFRVGLADEELPQRGITHLVEHCVVGELRNRPYEPFGYVRVSTTGFGVVGTPHEVADFLLGISVALGAFPVDRIDHERRVLRTEEEELGARWSSVGGLFSRRWGAQTWGLRDSRQVGLLSLHEDAIQGWVEDWFTAGNCVVILNGELPPGFDFSLPTGPRRPCPGTAPLPAPYPAFAPSHGPVMAMSMTGPRGSDFIGGGESLARRLHDRLREREGISYQPDWHYEPLDADVGHLTLWATSLHESGNTLADAFVEEVEQFIEQGPRPDELKRLRTGWFRMEPRERERSILGHRAYDLLMDRRESPDSYDNPEWDSVHMADTFRGAIKTALAVLPDGGQAPRGWNAYPLQSASEVIGRAYRQVKSARDPASPRVLVVGEDGVSLRSREGQHTVLFDECVACLWWPNRWELIGKDGHSITVTAEWESADEVFNIIRARVPTRCWAPQAPEMRKP